jgi:hypothetical protein
MKENRVNQLYDFLSNETPMDISNIRLGDMASISDDNPVVNYHFLMLTDNDRGFSYNMLMPWISSVEPDLDDMVLFIKAVKAEVDGLYEKYGAGADIPLHLAVNYNEMQESGIDEYLDELAAIAGGSRDHEPLS